MAAPNSPFFKLPRDTATETTTIPTSRTSANTTAPTSPFFKLPRELRDRIYGFVGGHTADFYILKYQTDLERLFEGTERTHKAAIVSYPRSDMLLVSREFCKEYQDEMRRSMRLCLWARAPLSEDLPEFCIPDELDEVLGATLSVIPVLEVNAFRRLPKSRLRTKAYFYAFFSVADCMFSLRTVYNRSHYMLHRVEEWLDQKGSHFRPQFGRTTGGISYDIAGRPDIPVRKFDEVFEDVFHTPLYEMPQSYASYSAICRDRRITRNEWPEFRRRMQHEDVNEIIYKATSSSEPGAWRGMVDLEVESTTSFQYERVVQDMIEQRDDALTCIRWLFG